MGFGFNLIGFPLLLLATVLLLIYFKVTKSKTVLKILGGLWILIILSVILITIKIEFDRPLHLTKEQIAGNYRIDKSFYPGKNADWQYEHYKFTITPNDSIYFYVIRRDTVLKTYSGKLKYSSGPPDLWHIQGDTTFHIIKNPPTLYRGHTRFYYVFHSELYGNMFFRKE